jgi:hypothetical protein
MTITIGPGITVGAGVAVTPAPASIVTTGLVLSLDAGNPASYPGSGTTWTDTISSIPFTLNNSPAYSSNNGGYLEFVPASSQWADSTVDSDTKCRHKYIGYYRGTNAVVVEHSQRCEFLS